MTAPSLTPESVGGPPDRKELLAEIDASCRTPVLLLFVGALLWLLLASGFALIASIKLHAPGFLAGCPSLTYGRIQPAALDCFLYGFASQAAFGVVLWLICRLGQAPLCCPGYVVGAKLFWNLGVAVGVFGVLNGDSTGFDWLELPRYASPILFVAYALVGLAAIVTLHQRRERELYVSQWFLFAGLLAFPWLYSAAQMLLVFQPVRGVMQAVVNGWFVHGLRELWFGAIGLAVVFYFVPKLLGRPLHSRYLALFAFWLLMLFGGWGGVPAGAPTPRWMSSMCVVSGVLMLVPLAAVATNLHLTIVAGGCGEKIKSNVTLKFMIFGLFCYLLSGLLHALNGLPGMASLTQFTHFSTALTWLNLYGFFAMVLFGAIYFIVPRLMQMEFPEAGWVRFHFLASTVGGILYVMPLFIGGLVQGAALNDKTKPFVEVVKSTLPFVGFSTLGLTLVATGNLALMANLVKMLVRCCRECCDPAALFSNEGKAETAEATR